MLVLPNKQPTNRQCDFIAICFVRSIFMVGLLGLWTSVSIHRTLYNGSCCDMTFSASQFLEIPWIDTEEETATDDDSNQIHWCSSASRSSLHNPHNYRLLQFYDVRDKRFQQYDSIQHKHPTTTECPAIPPITNPGTPLLYIHGHWGSYEQSRSLGAHGINLTQSQMPHHVLQRHLQNLLHSKEIYDVYALDYHREGGALHSYRLWEQAAIIEHAIRSIVHRITLSQRATDNNTASTTIKVTIVAHSIGGMVARAAFVPRGRPSFFVHSYVSTLITLATPHTSLPIAMDESVHKFYDTVNSYWKENSQDLNHVAVISISGGYRDEMIHPRLCSLDGYITTSNTSKNRFSVLAADMGNYYNIPSKIHANHKSIMGMDHQAIVWCHNLLSSIRTILFSSNTSNNDNYNNMAQLRDLLKGKQKDHTSNLTTTFAISLKESTQFLYKALGSFGSIAYEASHISNLGNIVIFYCASCFLCTIGSRHSSRKWTKPDRDSAVHSLQIILLAGALSIGQSKIHEWSLVHGSALCLSAIWAQMLNWSVKWILSLRWQLRTQKKYQIICASTLTCHAVLLGHIARSSTILFDWASFKAHIFLALFSFIAVSTALHFSMSTSCTDDPHPYHLGMNTLMLLPVILLLLSGKAIYAFSLLSSSRGAYGKLDQGNDLFSGVTLVLFPVLGHLGLRSVIDIYGAMLLNVQKAIEAKVVAMPRINKIIIIFLLGFTTLFTLCRWAFDQGIYIVSFIISAVATIELACQVFDQAHRQTSC